jgi:hypothetical protein
VFPDHGLIAEEHQQTDLEILRSKGRNTGAVAAVAAKASRRVCAETPQIPALTHPRVRHLLVPYVSSLTTTAHMSGRYFEQRNAESGQ